MFKLIIYSLTVTSISLILVFSLMLHDHNKVIQHDFAIHNLVTFQSIYEAQRNKISRHNHKQKEIRCLADNIYYEAAHEPLKGKGAVALVTMNRVNHPDFPNDVCGVVYERNKKLCQFSWVCGVNKAHNRKEYQISEEVAKKVYRNYEKMYDFTNGSLYYHADYLKEEKKKFFKTRKFSKKIGRHLFYM